MILDQKRDEPERAALEARLFCESSGGGGYSKDLVYVCERLGRRLEGPWTTTFGERTPGVRLVSPPIGPRSRRSSLAG